MSETLTSHIRVLATYTIEEAIEHMGYGRFQIRISAIAGLAWVCIAISPISHYFCLLFILRF